MKRLLTLALALCLAMALAPRAKADLIFHPLNDPYGMAHRDEEEDVDRYDMAHYVNSPDGEITCYFSPEADRIMMPLENGTLVRICAAYTLEDGTRWGLLTFSVEGLDDARYVRMDGLLNRYDDPEFRADHADEITEEEPEGVSGEWKGEKIVWWSYPGGVPTVEDNRRKSEDLVRMSDLYYTDENGLIWGRYQLSNGPDYWLCLSDPDNADLRKPETFTGNHYFEPQTEYTKDGKIGSASGTVTAVLLMGAIAVTMAVLLIWPKKKKEEET